MTNQPRRALAVIAVSQLLVLTVWFSASAVTPQLQIAWTLSTSEVAWLTLAVQLGFVVGAFTLAVLNTSDVTPTRTLFAWAGSVAVLANAALVFVSAPAPAIVLRFVTGAALAGVYPSGLKAMAGWFQAGRGKALGVLVGALTIGSATPHLIRGLGFEWRGVVLVASGLAALGTIAMRWLVEDGPFEPPVAQFSWRHITRVVTNQGYRLSTIGYLGHMWELYAMWTWVALFVGASAEASGRSYGPVPVIAFAIIAIGGPAAWWAGRLSDRYGRTRVAGTAMAISGSCALASPLIFGTSPLLAIPVLLVWGAAVVADSAQFSTMVTETTHDDVRGTALTLQTALGFSLTMVTIRLIPEIADMSTWQWAFPVLALGPAAGVAAMVRLKRSAASSTLAGGIG
ncbi:MAG: MFS transporter [Acidimicrobiia bacterium]|nr:MFS transporter [Acidimicrobiia bacterium]MDH5420770.1 MFS transporter [Acidimicrobiia bacterium]MDH5502595.1 MFS transporter [Acidimicrobiia bacterium]